VAPTDLLNESFIRDGMKKRKDKFGNLRIDGCRYDAFGGIFRASEYLNC